MAKSKLGKKATADVSSLSSQLAEKANKSEIVSDLNIKQNISFFSTPKEPLVTFIDDDGYIEVKNVLQPIFQSRNVPCTLAIISGKVGTAGFMTESDLATLSGLGWEFLTHTVDHGHLTTYNLTDLEYQQKASKDWLTQRGYPARGHVYPYSDQNLQVRNITRKYYDFAFGNQGIDNGFLDSMLIKRIATGSYTTQNPTVNGNSEKSTLAYYKACVDYAVANNLWLVFENHIKDSPSDQVTILAQLVDYIKSINVKIVNASDGYRAFGNKLFIGDLSTNYVAINENGIFTNKITNYGLSRTNGKIKFNGSSYVSLPPNVGDFTGTGKFAFEFKFKPTVMDQEVISKKDETHTASQFPQGWGIRTSSAGKLTVDGVETNGGAETYAVGSTVLTINNTYYCRIIYDGSALSMYTSTDGVAWTTETVTITGTLSVLVNSFNINGYFEPRMGQMWRGSSGYTRQFTGELYYLKIWKKTVDVTKLPVHNYQFINYGDTLISDLATNQNGQGFNVTQSSL